MSAPNPYNLTFPYPVQGPVTRPPGQGCMACVHSPICPAVYWFRRFTFKELDVNMGRACASFSSSSADKNIPISADDLKEEDYMYIQGIGSEPNRNGITEATGGSRQSEGT